MSWTPPSAEALGAAMSMGDVEAARQLSKQCLAEERDHYRQQLQGAVSALREVERICAVAGGERSSSPAVVQITQAARRALPSPRQDLTKETTDD